MAPSDRSQGGAVRLAVVVAALGYFVDIYDLLLFGIVRKASLEDIGVPASQSLAAGTLLLNVQMGALLLGGILWGVLGDKRGRLSVLFGSIVLYSLANVANGMIHTLPQYAAARFVAGIGLAGELGAGITLVSESLDKRTRGYGTTIVATVGILGAVAGALVAKLTFWRTSYFVGGGLGLALLLLRVGVLESGVYERLKKEKAHVSRGNFFRLFSSWPRARRYVAVILVGVPIWYVVAILITFAPEVGKAMGLEKAPDAAFAIMINYTGLAVGDFSSGALSQIIKSRKRALFVFIALTAASVAIYFAVGGRSLFAFYAACALLGVATGYWAVFVTVASEQFGTNLRATATTTAPNFVRGAVVPITVAFNALKGSLGVRGSALLVGAVTLALAMIALTRLEETYGKDLDFID
ncbi:MAG TPA: MFS transporter [Polyangiaceae bacterium]|nr:MFS transporter [Polyangiaceae bacterium]